jgi:ribonuclease Z
LGTGSAIPSKYRNVSAIHLIPSPTSSGTARGILMDAGEGTLAQLVRAVGVAEADSLVANLGCIWISHLHADHHLGLLNILARYYHLRRQRALASVNRIDDGSHASNTIIQSLCDVDMDDRLVIVGPRRLWRWLEEFSLVAYASAHDRAGYLNALRFIPCNDLLPSSASSSPSSSSSPLMEWFKRRLGLSRVFNIRVPHCYDSFALIIHHVTGWSLVYSGDTLPCDALVEAGRGATVCICYQSLLLCLSQTIHVCMYVCA